MPLESASASTSTPVRVIRWAALPILIGVLLWQPDRFIWVPPKALALAALGFVLVWAFRHSAGGHSGLAPGLRHLVSRGGNFVRVILAVVGLWGVVIAAMPFSHDAAQVLIDRFLLNRSFLFWAFWQPCPAFYSAENRWVTIPDDGQGPPDGEAFRAAFAADPHFIIHHPARATFWQRDLDLLGEARGAVWDVVESRYRDQASRIIYRVEYAPGLRVVRRYGAEHVR